MSPAIRLRKIPAATRKAKRRELEEGWGTVAEESVTRILKGSGTMRSECVLKIPQTEGRADSEMEGGALKLAERGERVLKSVRRQRGRGSDAGAQIRRRASLRRDRGRLPSRNGRGRCT